MSKNKSKSEEIISEQDQQFFLDEVADVRPLKSESRVETVKNRPAPRPIHSQNGADSNEHLSSDMISDPIDLREAKVEDVLFYARSGIQHKVQKKLRRGEFPIEDELDLHGYTVAEAKAALQDFFHECKRNNIRYIRIIHGKGYRSEQNIPVLKTHVAYWLPQYPDVMAFSSAQARDGGTGALYVILKVVR